MYGNWLAQFEILGTRDADHKTPVAIYASVRVALVTVCAVVMCWVLAAYYGGEDQNKSLNMWVLPRTESLYQIPHTEPGSPVYSATTSFYKCHILANFSFSGGLERDSFYTSPNTAMQYSRSDTHMVMHMVKHMVKVTNDGRTTSSKRYQWLITVNEKH